MSSGNGQVSPAASNRRIVDRTVDGAAPTRRAISRLGISADFNILSDVTATDFKRIGNSPGSGGPSEFRTRTRYSGLNDLPQIAAQG
jgi:hypothetical protein